MDKWIEVHEVLPVLDAVIVARTANEFGFGYACEVYEFDSKMFTQVDAAMCLINDGFVSWLELPK